MYIFTPKNPDLNICFTKHPDLNISAKEKEKSTGNAQCYINLKYSPLSLYLWDDPLRAGGLAAGLRPNEISDRDWEECFGKTVLFAAAQFLFYLKEECSDTHRGWA